MNREIKFRAFENANCRNRMFEWSEIKKDFELWLNCKHTSVMQYTGLKDKNGKEIYEGDITDEGEVVFHTEYLGFFVKEDREEEYKPLYDFAFLEVIGNIHEHPELITKP